MHATPTTVSALVKAIYDRLILWTVKFTSGRHWIIKIFLLCVFFSIFFSGGIDFQFTERGGYQQGYFQKIEHPLLNITKLYGLNSHESNTNFRLTVPVVFHALGIHGYWSLPFLTIMAICMIMVVSCLAAFQLTGDRVCACFIALNVSATYVGSFAFIWYYDIIAICQLALAALPSMPYWGRAILVFTASFTDERAFVASGILLVANFFLYGPFQSFMARLRNPHFLAVAGAMLAYGISRLTLMKLAGLSSPLGGNGPGVLVNESATYLHTTIWFSLEGGWILVVLAAAILLAHRDFLTVTSLLLVSLFALLFYLCISDSLRSTIYLFPLLYIALTVLSRNESVPMLRIYCLLVFLVSAVSGNYNVYLGRITWFQPLSFHLLQVAGQTAYNHFYNFLPHTMPRAH